MNEQLCRDQKLFSLKPETLESGVEQYQETQNSSLTINILSFTGKIQTRYSRSCRQRVSSPYVFMNTKATRTMTILYYFEDYFMECPQNQTN